eukprot:TRINITY_DN849_c0_g1_i1.p2 TRINITY_DN849_c0_g1~~TRINITY_DN849_c0_g1_i1.p2  ORF type:complete len:273 (-),score=95.17 TRINITY_DN849_c0_g1_i1:961-1680(-)
MTERTTTAVLPQEPENTTTKPFKVLAINGSPRRQWNTGKMLMRALEGAASKGAQTEFIHLHPMNIKGCASCFACKQKGGKSYGRCALKDDLAEVLRKVDEADAVLIGTPIFWSNATSCTRALIERMLFRHVLYDAEMTTLVPRKKPIGLVFTMNVDQETAKAWGYQQTIDGIAASFGRAYGAENVSTVVAWDTYQFADYGRYETSMWDEPHKRAWHDEQFPRDLDTAFELGARFVASSA